MADSRGAPVPDNAVESDGSDVGVEFINGDDFPLACIHPGKSCFDHPVRVKRRAWLRRLLHRI